MAHESYFREFLMMGVSGFLGAFLGIICSSATASIEKKTCYSVGMFLFIMLIMVIVDLLVYKKKEFSKEEKQTLYIVIVLLIMMLFGILTLSNYLSTQQLASQNIPTNISFNESDYCEVNEINMTCLPEDKCQFQNDSDGSKVCLGKY